MQRTNGLAYKVGAHVSTAKGVQNAVTNSANMGGNSFALFLKSQRQWVGRKYEQTEVDEFHGRCKEHSYKTRDDVLPHGSYLINLASPDATTAFNSLKGFVDDLQRCELLGISRYNLHPGATVGYDKEKCIKRLAANIDRGLEATEFVKVVLENMAGQGTTLGGELEDLAKIIELVQNKERIGVCIDTCHTFAAGYDLRDEKSFNKFWNKFDKIVGYKYLAGIHLNDSKTPLGSNRDLHENIGHGFIGLESFRLLMNKPELEGLPLILETPGEDEARGVEVKLLEWLTGKKADNPEVLDKSVELQKLGAKNRKVEQDKMDKKKKSSKPAPRKPLDKCLEDKDVLETFEKDADKFLRERDASEIMMGEDDKKPAKKRAKKEVKKEVKEEEVKEEST